jgi:hypothetical protein
MKTWGNGGIATLFLTLTIDLVSFMPRSLYLPGEITAGTHWIGRVGPRVGLGAVEKKTCCTAEDRALKNFNFTLY